MTRLAVLTSIALAVSAGGCDGTLSPDESLARARALWAANGSDDYTVESRIACFCPAYMYYWTKLTVVNGEVINAEPVEDLPEGWEPSTTGWQTVEELFDTIGQSVPPLIVDVDATFDPSLGYPRHVGITCNETVADCESVREMRNLRITR
jgi:hypothetical protein